MSEFISGRRWMNGREVCRYVAKKLCERSSAEVYWTDMSEKWPCDVDPRCEGAGKNGPIYTYRVMFSILEFGESSQKDRFLHMDAVQENGGNIHVGMSSKVGVDTYLPEAVAECLHGLVDDDSVPQYAVYGDVDVYQVRPMDKVPFVYDEDDPARKEERYGEEGSKSVKEVFNEILVGLAGLDLNDLGHVRDFITGIKEGSE